MGLPFAEAFGIMTDDGIVNMFAVSCVITQSFNVDKGERRMAENLEIYKCRHCGIIVEVVHAGGGELVCCGEEMMLMKENTVDAAKEKHVPVIEKNPNGGYKVSVGGVPHPMEEKHYIEWIELIADCKTYREFLKPGQAPEATFCVEAASVTAREYCNIHGLWKKD